MTYTAIVPLLLGAWLVSVRPALAQPSSVLPPEAEQVLFLVDNSASMTERAFDPDQPAASRWEVLQRAYPQWLARLAPDVLVGALSVGGACGAPPAIRLPVGTARAQVTAAIDATRPSGWTNLNAALQAVPDLFAPGVRGGKRLILLSDGRNTCPPHGSTCAIARDLRRQHGITIDVVAWITEPRMVEEFQCVTQATGGTFTAPRTLEEWLHIPLPALDPWRYVVFGLGMATLLLASSILYRHGVHVWHWETGRATLAAGLLLGLGTLALYLALFVSAGLGAALLGGAILAVLLAVARRRAQCAATAAPPATPWAILGLVVATITLVPLLVRAADTAPTPCSKVVQGPPRYHHILALDVSGSVVPHLEQMKALLACYAARYTLAGEELSLLVFGSDAAGTVKELTTFAVPPEGATPPLTSLLDDLVVQHPQATKTYFRPLADAVNQLLRRVRLEPVLLVVSDGQSDAKQDKVPFQEIPFESFGTRGIYSVPGVQAWKVAIQGGSGLDLAALFHKPLSPHGTRTPVPLPRLLRAAIDPCLLEPDLFVDTDERLVLQPRWWPFATMVEGVLTLRVRHACVARYRSFRVEVRRGEETWGVGRVEQVLIDQQPHPFSFPIVQPARGAGVAEAAVRLLLDQGGTTRTIYPQTPLRLTLEEVAYWAAYGRYWGIGGGMLLVVGGLTVGLVRRQRMQQRTQPEVITVLGGHGVPVRRGQAVAIGGVGCTLVVPGVAQGTVLAVAEWTGTRGMLTLRPGHDFRMQVQGVEVDGSITYRLGQPLRFVHSTDNTTTYDVTLHPGTANAVGFGATVSPARNGAYTPEGFLSVGRVRLTPENGAAGAVPGAARGGGIGTDAYI
jgi:hypothetical protein